MNREQKAGVTRTSHDNVSWGPPSPFGVPAPVDMDREGGLASSRSPRSQTSAWETAVEQNMTTLVIRLLSIDRAQPCHHYAIINKRLHCFGREVYEFCCNYVSPPGWPRSWPASRSEPSPDAPPWSEARSFGLAVGNGRRNHGGPRGPGARPCRAREPAWRRDGARGAWHSAALRSARRTCNRFGGRLIPGTCREETVSFGTNVFPTKNFHGQSLCGLPLL